MATNRAMSDLESDDDDDEITIMRSSINKRRGKDPIDPTRRKLLESPVRTYSENKVQRSQREGISKYRKYRDEPCDEIVEASDDWITDVEVDNEILL